MSEEDHSPSYVARRRPRPPQHPPPPSGAPPLHSAAYRASRRGPTEAKIATKQSRKDAKVATPPLTAVSGAGYGRQVGPLIASAGDHKSQPDKPAFPSVHRTFLPDPAVQSTGASKPSTVSLVPTQDDKPEAVARCLETQVHALLEASAFASRSGQLGLALNKAKEAQKKERALTRARESSNLVDAMNGELTYAVALHLGSMYEGNGMEDEALHVYRGLLEQRALLPPVAGWARLNMGNVYYRKGRYAEAVKMYRMTLDQIPSTSHKAMRLKVYRNIGYAFVRLQEWQEAVQALEIIVLNPITHLNGERAGTAGEDGMGGALVGSQGGGQGAGGNKAGLSRSQADPTIVLPSSAAFSTSLLGSPRTVVFGDYFRTAYLLLMCYLVLGEVVKMKRAFAKMVSTLPTPLEEDEDIEEEAAAEKEGGARQVCGPGGGVERDDEMELWEAAAGGRRTRKRETENTARDAEEQVKPDFLREEMQRRRQEGVRYVLAAGKLLAPVVEATGGRDGYQWVVEALKRGNHGEVACLMELERASACVREKRFDPAVEILRSFERKEIPVKAWAASSLSFVYFLEGELEKAEELANLAVEHNSYNASALVNKANCVFQRGDVGAAKDLYLEALGVEAGCLEALFNLGVANLRLGRLSDAQDAYEKLHTLTPHCPEVLYQLGHIAEGQGQASEAIRWFQVLLAELRARGKGMGKEKMLYQRDGRGGSNRGVEEGGWTSSSSLGLSSGSSLSSPSTPGAGSHTMMGGDLPPSTIDAVSGGMAAVDDEVLARLGRLYDAEGAEAQALHHFQESDRVNPFNLEVISWLGLWFARQEQYTTALIYFHRAAVVQPDSSRWPLMQASCHRRLGDFLQALKIYECVHAAHPEDTDCLKALVTLCRDLGRPWEGYQQRLLRLQEAGRSEGEASRGEGARGIGERATGERGELRGLGRDGRGWVLKGKKKGTEAIDVDVSKLLI